jgi:hypothetical protein
VSSGKAVLTGNQITNFNTGIKVIYASPIIKYNTIVQGNKGIWINNPSGPIINFNNIYDQVMVDSKPPYQILNQNCLDIDAQYNYWGPAMTDSMNRGGNPKNLFGIFDHFDSTFCGTVDYTNWFTRIYTNTPPQITSVPPSRVQRGQLYQYQAQAWDKENDPLAYALQNPPAGMTIDSTSGLLQWTPLVAGNNTVRIMVRDTAYGEASQQYILTVYNDTVPPDNHLTLTASALTKNAIRLQWNPGAILATDADSVGIWYRTDRYPLSPNESGAVRVPGFGRNVTSDTVSGLVTNRTYYFTLLVHDSAGNWSDTARSAQDTARIINHAPQWVGDSTVYVHEDSLLTYHARLYDMDGDSVTLTLGAHPAWLSLQHDTIITGTAPHNAPDTVFHAIFTDGDLVDTAIVAVYVVTAADSLNSAPSLTLTPISGNKSGDVVFSYVITDAEKDTIRLLTPSYSVTNGAAWLPATVTGKTTSITESDYSGSLTWRSEIDLRGQVRDSVRFRLMPFDVKAGRGDSTGVFSVRNLLGDYDHDLAIDFDDFAVFALAWRQHDTTKELGPVTGTLPSLTLTPDGVLDGKDLYTFIRTWNWAAAHPAALSKTAVPPVCGDVRITMTQRNDAWICGLTGAAELLAVQLTVTPLSGHLTGLAPAHDAPGMLSVSRLEDDGTAGVLMLAAPDLPGLPADMAAIKVTGAAAVRIDFEVRDMANRVIARGQREFNLAPSAARAAVTVTPHPFTSALCLNYAGPHTGNILLNIHAADGTLVRTITGTKSDEDSYSMNWDGTNSAGRALPVGLYHYRLSINGAAHSGRLLKTR